jgi:hypothetical protein
MLEFGRRGIQAPACVILCEEDSAERMQGRSARGTDGKGRCPQSAARRRRLSRGGSFAFGGGWGRYKVLAQGKQILPEEPVVRPNVPDVVVRAEMTAPYELGKLVLEDRAVLLAIPGEVPDA